MFVLCIASIRSTAAIGQHNEVQQDGQMDTFHCGEEFITLHNDGDPDVGIETFRKSDVLRITETPDLTFIITLKATVAAVGENVAEALDIIVIWGRSSFLRVVSCLD